MAIALSILTLSFAWVQGSIELYKGKLRQRMKTNFRIKNIVGAIMGLLASIGLFFAVYATPGTKITTMAMVHLFFLILVGIIEPISMIIRSPSLSIRAATWRKK